jgi:acyl-CoA synthetase (AMP-forming)/AMP-acid ligase II
MSSLLIEKTLREHPSVLEAAVIGVPDPVLGQEVKAFIVTKAPVTEEELRRWVNPSAVGATLVVALWLGSVARMLQSSKPPGRHKARPYELRT